MIQLIRIRSISLWAALGTVALLSSACKSQDPAVLLTINGQYRIPQDLDTLRVDIYAATSADAGTGAEISSQTFTNLLNYSPNGFPFTVLLDDSGAMHDSIDVIVTGTVMGATQPVGLGEVFVQLTSGTTVDAAVDLVDQ